MSRADASTQLLALGAALGGMMGAQLADVAGAVAIARGDARDALAARLRRVAGLLRIEASKAASVYEQAAGIVAEVTT